MTPPSPNPVSMVRWEDSSSLEHSCWACPNKANSPKALHSCYGIHSMPCLAYHPTMHAVGAAHRCSACTSGREVHDGRHREIAQLLADYHAFEEADREHQHNDRILQERPLNLPLRQRQMVQHDVQIGENHEVQDIDKDGGDDLSVIDTASTVTSNDDRGLPKLTKSEQRERKRALKAQKSQDKAAKNQAKHNVQVTSQDIQRISHILHGDQAETQLLTHPLATDVTIEDVIARNKGFVKQMRCHMKDLKQQVAQGRKEEKERKLHKRRVSEGLIEDVETEAVVNAILAKLGIHPAVVADTASTNHHDAKNHHHHITPRGRKTKTAPKTPTRLQDTKVGIDVSAGLDVKKATKSQTAIVTKLRDAIRDDLEKHENELKQTYIRAGAFFRYAGRQVFERMTEIASRIDVQTGEEWEKKMKRENHGAAHEVDQPNRDEGDEDIQE